MGIITVNREFGSGGRELGKRLSDALQIPYYDDEIIKMVAEEHGLDEKFVARVSEKSIQATYALTIGHRFSVPYQMMDPSVKVAVAQRKLIEALAEQGDCIIIGRCAGIILDDKNPLKLFVYADQQSKLKRCIDRAPEGENFTPAEIKRMMKEIDRNRAKLWETFADSKWGAKENYHLCINTSGKEIKTLIPALADYIKIWFEQPAK